MAEEVGLGVILQSLDRADHAAMAWMATKAVETAADQIGYPDTGPVRDAIAGVRQEIGGSAWNPAQTSDQLQVLETSSRRRNTRQDAEQLRTAALNLCNATTIPRATNPYFRLAVISASKAIAFNVGPTERLIGPASRPGQERISPDREAEEEARYMLMEAASETSWPITYPNMDELKLASPKLQVSWDAVSDPSDSEISLLNLAMAFRMAQRLGLDWRIKLQRAIAERCTDEERLSRLLSVT